MTLMVHDDDGILS